MSDNIKPLKVVYKQYLADSYNEHGNCFDSEIYERETVLDAAHAYLYSLKNWGKAPHHNWTAVRVVVYDPEYLNDSLDIAIGPKFAHKA
jgi:hypothetical protein